MTDKFENIDSEEIVLNANGELEISAELQDAVAGGFNPESEEEEMGVVDAEVNTKCTVSNGSC